MTNLRNALTSVLFLVFSANALDAHAIGRGAGGAQNGKDHAATVRALRAKYPGQTPVRLANTDAPIMTFLKAMQTGGASPAISDAPFKEFRRAVLNRMTIKPAAK